MTCEHEYQKKNPHMTQEADLTLEVVILIIFGIFMLLFGVLLFQIHTGALAYAPDSTYGLFLFLVAFQIVTMGKTPFGDLTRSWFLILIGMGCAIFGMLASFIPGYFSDYVRIFVGGVLCIGGGALLLQLFIREDMARAWRQYPQERVLRYLILACGLVYVLSCICGLITLIPGITSDHQTAVILLLYGGSFLFLAACLQITARRFPIAHHGATHVQEKSDSRQTQGLWILLKQASLSLSLGVLRMVGLLLTVLGVVLIQVNLGVLPFSQDGLLGMLLVIFSIQMMALGETPIGPFRRSWLMILIGMVFATLGIISCVVPGLLTALLQFLIGVLNILGGALLLIGRLYTIVVAMHNSPAQSIFQPPILKKLAITQTIST
jgi:small-conductance mechanosensitive channel